MRHITSATLLAVSLLAVPALFADEPEEGMLNYTWKTFSFTYPEEGWTLTEMKKEDNELGIKLQSSRKEGLSILLTFRDDFPPLDGAAVDNPTMVAVGFGLPIALRLAENQSDRISITFGEINFAEEWNLSARFLVRKPEGPEFVQIEAFKYFADTQPVQGILGAMITDGAAGNVSDSPDYYNPLIEAYAIIQSITIDAGK